MRNRLQEMMALCDICGRSFDSHDGGTIEGDTTYCPKCEAEMLNESRIRRSRRYREAAEGSSPVPLHGNRSLLQAEEMPPEIVGDGSQFEYTKQHERNNKPDTGAATGVHYSRTGSLSEAQLERELQRAERLDENQGQS